MVCVPTWCWILGVRRKWVWSLYLIGIRQRDRSSSLRNRNDRHLHHLCNSNCNRITSWRSYCWSFTVPKRLFDWIPASEFRAMRRRLRSCFGHDVCTKLYCARFYMHSYTYIHFMFFRIKMQWIPDLVPPIFALNGSSIVNMTVVLLKYRALDLS